MPAIDDVSNFIIANEVEIVVSERLIRSVFKVCQVIRVGDVNVRI